MSYWKIIVPETTINLFSDPSFALADPATEWTISGNGVAPDYTRDTTYACVGFSSAQADIDAGGGGTWACIYQMFTVTNTAYYLSARVRRTGGGVPTASHVRAWFDTAVDDWDSITALEDGWYLCEYTATATAGARSFGVYAIEDDLYVDGCQLEHLGYRTTYCDGDQPGCSWNGSRWASASTRSAAYRGGGRVYDLADTYSARVTGVTGIGMPQLANHWRNYALLPGAEFDRTAVQPRVIQLVFNVSGTSHSNLHALRQALIEILRPDALPNQQPVLLQYTGAGRTVQIPVRYDSGLEHKRWKGFTEDVAIRFIALEPFWTIAEQQFSQTLANNASATWLYFVGGGATQPASVDAGAGGNKEVHAILRASDGKIWIGGDFQNWDNDADCDHICYWDPDLDDWADANGGVNDIVRDICEGPDGTIYIAGEFTNADAGGDADYLAYWTGAAWEEVGGGGHGGNCYALCFGLDGKLYVGGVFTDYGDANGDCIVSWDGSAWASLGDGFNGAVWDLACAPNGDIVAVGAFTADGDGAGTYRRAAVWDGSSWAELATGLDNTARAVAITPSGKIYVGGTFLNDGPSGITLTRLAETYGTGWTQVGDGANGNVRALELAPDGVLYLGGAFTNFHGVSGADYVARWNGTQGAALWITLPGAPIVTAIETFGVDPEVKHLFSTAIGWNTTGTGYYQGTTTVTNNGTAAVHPRLLFTRSGGTSATIYLLHNDTTGREIYMDYAMVDGETLELDLRPGKFAFTSSMFGNRLDAILPSSDRATFQLQPGANTITCYIYTVGAPTIGSYMMWDETYWSAD